MVDKYNVFIDKSVYKNPHNIFVLDENRVLFTLPLLEQIPEKTASSKDKIKSFSHSNKTPSERIMADCIKFMKNHEYDLIKVNNYVEDTIEKVSGLKGPEKSMLRNNLNKFFIREKRVYLDYFRDLNQ